MADVHITAEADYQIGSDRRLVIGLGTGRSGTVSLSRLLDSQASASVNHELRPLLPWVFEKPLIDYRLRQLSARDAQLIGDVAYYYLPYVRYIADQVPRATFVCMRRDRSAVIDSMMRKTKNDNLWVDHDGSEWTLNPIWDSTMPSYEPMPKPSAIGRYWDEYYEEATSLATELGDRFRIFDLEETLSNEDGVRTLLDHVGISPDEQILVQDIHDNALPREDALDDTVSPEDRQTELKQTIWRRDIRIADMERAIGRGSSRINNLERAVRGRDERIRELERAIAGRSERVAELEQAVARRSERVAELEQAVAGRDERNSELSTAILQRDLRIAQLQKAVAARGKRIVDLGASISGMSLEELDLQESIATEAVAQLQQRLDL